MKKVFIVLGLLLSSIVNASEFRTGHFECGRAGSPELKWAFDIISMAIGNIEVPYVSVTKTSPNYPSETVRGIATVSTTENETNILLVHGNFSTAVTNLTFYKTGKITANNDILICTE